MRIVRFETEGRILNGCLHEPDAIAFEGPAATCWASLMAGLMEGTLRPGTRRFPRHAVRLLPPMAPAGKIVGIGLNYADHAAEGGHPLPDFPAVFLRVPASVTGDGGALIRPAVSSRFDYEAELAVVIGRRARAVARRDAIAVVAGYSCFNDGSLRDFQRQSSQWTLGKNFDSSGALGPALVTADDLPDGPGALAVRLRLNGRLLQDGNTRHMIFDVPALIEIVSQAMTLEPGDVICTGTPAGVGFARKPPVFLQAGDVCAVEIETVGVLTNVVADEAPRPPLPASHQEARP